MAAIITLYQVSREASDFDSLLMRPAFGHERHYLNARHGRRREKRSRDKFVATIATDIAWSPCLHMQYPWQCPRAKLRSES